MGSKLQPIIERFNNKVDKSDGCWIWKGMKSSNGYGAMSIDYKIKMAHRVSYELHIGPIPAGLDLMHSCDNPLCVNPSHLTPGTKAENNRDRAVKGRSYGLSLTHCKSGHEFTPENTSLYIARGIVCRRCKKCACVSAKKTRLKRREQNGPGPGPGHLRLKTHCSQGHEFSPENTYYYFNKKGTEGPYRACRTCRYDANKRAINKKLTNAT